MNPFDWLSELLARFQDEHILVQRGSAIALAPAHLLGIDPEDWGRAAQTAAAYDCRWAGIWAEDQGGTLLVNAVLVRNGDHLVLRTKIPADTPRLGSHTPYFPGADRLERHMRDMFGIEFTDHPDPRRWSRHNRWPEGGYPLRKGFPADQAPLPPQPEEDYAFVQAQGAGVYEIPVGPVHAGIIEPGHFRFLAVGETVLNLEQRLGYVHKGIEKIAEGRDAFSLARLAGRISGDTTVHHAWTACMAMERAAHVIPPPRALALRAVMAERERTANHLGDIGAICNDVGFAFAQFQFSRLRELWLRDSAACFGHRLMMDRVIPGGVAADIDDTLNARLREGIDRLRGELPDLYAILNDHPSLEDRLVTTGVLAGDTARRLGVLGYMAKASGIDADLRRDHPYTPYEGLHVDTPLFDAGDVAARMKVRMQEILHSLELLEALLERIPSGEICSTWRTPAVDSEGLGIVEGWRGEILTHVRFGADGRVARFFPRDPSWFNWPALERLIHDNIVPDFPVCNKSVNGSYSGQDL